MLSLRGPKKTSIEISDEDSYIYFFSPFSFSCLFRIGEKRGYP